MNRSHVRFADLKGLFAVRRLNDIVATDFEHFPRELPDKVRVLGDENRFSTARGDTFVSLERFGWGEKSRKIDFEGRASIGLAAGRNVPSALFHNSVDCRQ